MTYERLIVALTMAVVIIVVSYLILMRQEAQAAAPTSIASIADINAYFPRSMHELKSWVDRSLIDAQEVINGIIAISDADRTFVNTAQALDYIRGLHAATLLENRAGLLEMVSPDANVREECHKLFIRIQEFYVDHVYNNKALYQAFKAYANGNAKTEQLTQTQHYFIDETMREFKRAGLDLVDDQLEKVRTLKKELAQLCLQFETNIAQDNRTIEVDRVALAGLSDDFVDSLKRTADGHYILGIDYPTYNYVIEYCDDAQTREKIWVAHINQSYPINDALLKEIIAKRDELARLVGFKSFDELDIDAQMAKTPERVNEFLRDLGDRAQRKAIKELEVFLTTAGLPVDTKIKPWDFIYLKGTYKKTHLKLDDEEVKAYFPMEHTIKGLLSIYEKFFNVTFKQEAISGLWDPEVTCISVNENGNLLGYLLLDLYPRANKYSHACHMTLIPALLNADGNPNVAFSIVICNFPKPTAHKPSLLRRDDVGTFFHEFGHALHAFFGRTHLATQAGTNVKLDFVELTSQMLEEWLWDRAILKMVSSHYQTGEPLPESLIDQIVALKQFDRGLFVARQVYYSFIALDFFSAGANKDPFVIQKELYPRLMPQFIFDERDHFYASFGHLTNYGSRYYGYMWSKVFALDLFYYIKKYGLLDGHIGQKYKNTILAPGGSQDPYEMLVAFLGREPNNEAFMRDLGL